MANWDELRKTKFAPDEPPDSWPTGVKPISIGGISFLGVHEESGKLFWDGKQVITRSHIELGLFERWLAGFAAAGTFGSFVVELGHAFSWWQ